MRSSGVEGVTVLMNCFSGCPNEQRQTEAFEFSRRAMQVMLCSGVLPKPMPGIQDDHARVNPARAAISKEREKSRSRRRRCRWPDPPGSRLCITMTGTPRSATRDAIRDRVADPRHLDDRRALLDRPGGH